MDPLSDLHVFQEIVDAGSFVKAAERLGMSPSAVSKRLSRYETRLGIRLLNRTTRSLSLTEAGATLSGRSRSIVAEVQLAEQAASQSTTTPTGNIRVSCSDAFALEVLVPTLGAFQARYPGVSVTVLQGDGPVDVVDERIDLAVRFEAPRHSDFVSVRLADDPWVVCASPAYLQACGTPQVPEALRQHRCLTIRARDRATDRWRFTVAGTTREIAIDSAFSAIGAVVKVAALEGLGIARLAQFLVREPINRGELVPLLQAFEPPQERGIYLVYPHREFVPLKVRLLVDHLRAQFDRPIQPS